MSQINDVSDITVPIAVTPPPSQFPVRQHPLQPVGFSGNDLQNPIETNKWWGTIPIPSAQDGNLFSFPYTLWWGKSNPSGMNISHIEASQLVFDTAHSPPQYYFNPVGIISWNMGATQFDANMNLNLDTPTQFTINVSMLPANEVGYLKFPLAQGMAFITGLYTGLTPSLTTVGHAILSFQSFGLSGANKKYKVSLNDGTTWLIYVFPWSDSTFSLSQIGSSLVGSGLLNGYIQIAKLPTGDTTSEVVYDSSAGTFVTSMQLFGSTSGSTGTYGYIFTTAGLPNPVLHFALPHHQDSFDDATKNIATGIYLQSTTMGKMRAYRSNKWTMTETLPTSISFLPAGIQVPGFSADTISAIQTAAQADIGTNVSAETNLNSQYFAGKAMAKFAEICLVANDVLKDQALVAMGLTKLKAAFSMFINNQQQAPLCYENTWKGLVSTAGFSDSGADFGNTYYNDHHYHYGYFIYAAALLGHIDPSWLTPTNVDYVNSLVRDVANPSSQDPYFPVFRSFDWFVGHSWSKGLFASGDGKDEESSSEDYNFSYGMKLWGIVTQNAAVQARGDLMLAIQKR